MTHRDILTLDASGFLARLAFRVLRGMRPVSAIEDVTRSHFEGSMIQRWVQKARESSVTESVQAIKDLGQACPTPGAFPSVIHLICRHEDDLKEALIQDVMAGGDSASRGMAVGMVLGAHLGMDAIPSDWLSGMKRRREIEELLKKLRP
jgi:ADP-ribosylglycohydrolase